MSLGPVDSVGPSDAYRPASPPAASPSEPASAAAPSPAVIAEVSRLNPIMQTMRSALDDVAAYRDMGEQYRLATSRAEAEPQVIDPSLAAATQQLRAQDVQQQLTAQSLSISNQHPMFTVRGIR